jgi:hypothetical protein
MSLTTPPNTGLITSGQSEPTGLVSVSICRHVGERLMNDLDRSLDWDDIGLPEEAKKAWELALGHFVSSQINMIWEVPDFDWREFIAERYAAFYNLYNGFHDGTPIEHIMAAQLCFITGEWLDYPVMGNGPWSDDPKWHSKDRPFFGISAQESIGSYSR